MAGKARAVLDSLLHWMRETGFDYATDLVAALVILAAGACAIKVLSSLLRKGLNRTDERHALAVRFIVSVIVKSAWAVLIVVVLGKLGVNVGPLIAGLGVTGFILGFAFQESLGSLASGLMIALNEPFKVGDYVAVGGYEGTVLQLDMMAVTLATPDNRRITIPNKSAWGTPIVNYSALPLRRVDLTMGISYDTSIPHARETALAALAAVPGVLADPAPTAEVKSFDDSAITLAIRGWVANADYWRVYYAASQSLKEAFDKAGIDIPFPQMDVRLVAGNAPQNNVKGK